MSRIRRVPCFREVGIAFAVAIDIGGFYSFIGPDPDCYSNSDANPENASDASLPPR